MKRIALFSLLLLTATQSVAKATANTSAATTATEVSKASFKTRATRAFSTLTKSNKRIASVAIIAGGCSWGVYEELHGNGVVSTLKKAKDKAVHAFNELTGRN